MTSFVKAWLIRLLLLVVFSAIGIVGWTAYNWISPEKVRLAVERHLQEKFDDRVEVRVGAACIRVFGGVSVHDIQLTRRGEDEPFLSIPCAVVAHDKERLNQGELVLRKVDIDDLVLRIERSKEGTLNLGEYLKPGTDNQPWPSVQFKNATIIVTDRSEANWPKVTIRKANLQLLNDPVTVIKLDGQFELAFDHTPLSGTEETPAWQTAATMSFRLNRQTRQMQTKLEFPEATMSAGLIESIKRFCPEAGEYAGRYEGQFKLKGELGYRPDAPQPVSYDLRVDLNGGQIRDPMLPWPIEKLTGAIRYHEGKFTVDKLTAKLGNATAELNLESRAEPVETRFEPARWIAPSGPRIRPPQLSQNWLPLRDQCKSCEDDMMQALESRLEKLDFQISHLALDDSFFQRMTEKAQRIREIFSPSGTIDLGLKFSRTEHQWRREIELRPNKLSATYEKFRYPMNNLSGTLKKIVASDGTDEYRVNMTALAGGRRIEVTGKVAGEGPDPHIAVRIAGTDIPIDDKLFNALPPKYAQSLGKLRAKARGDFVVDIRQPYQVNRCENTFRVRVYNGSVNYTHFPYPFTQLRGNVLLQVSASDPTRPLRPGMPLSPEVDSDRVELRNFEAAHDGGRMWLDGESEAVAGSNDRKMTLRMQGESWPIDEQFKNALKEIKLESAIDQFSPRGDITFGAELEIWDRHVDRTLIPPPITISKKPPSPDGIQQATALLPAEPPFNPATDLRLAINFKGPSITPDFFRYDLHELAGVVRYYGGRVELSRFSAKHGPSIWKMEAADVRFADAGQVWANVGGVNIAPFVPDDAFVKAMPAKLKSTFDELNIRGTAELDLKHLVISIPAKSSQSSPAFQPQVSRNLPKVTVRAQQPLVEGIDRWKSLDNLPANPTTGPTIVLPGQGDKTVIVVSDEGSVPIKPVDHTQFDKPKSLNPVKPYSPVPLGNHQETPQTSKPKFGETAVLQPPAPQPESSKPGRFSITLPWQKKETPPAPQPIPRTPVGDENPVVYWNAILKLQGGSIDTGITLENVHGSFASEGVYESTHLGSVIGNVWIEKAIVAKQPISAGKVSYRIRPQQPDPQQPGQWLAPVVEFPDITTTLFHGTVSGQARVVLADPIRYRVYASASGVRLDEFARHYKLGSGADLSGLAQGSILLENTIDPKTGRTTTIGNGQVDVPQGRMYNLPVLLELVKVLKGQTPDGCAFDEAHATFEVRGDRVKVTQLDLLGSAVSLGGSGELDTSGEYVKFEFFTIWSQTLKRWLSTPLGDVTSMLSGSLLKIELTRENGKLTPKSHMLPVVTDPVRNVAERLRNRFQRPEQSKPRELSTTRSYENR